MDAQQRADAPRSDIGQDGIRQGGTILIRAARQLVELAGLFFQRHAGEHRIDKGFFGRVLCARGSSHRRGQDGTHYENACHALTRAPVAPSK